MVVFTTILNWLVSHRMHCNNTQPTQNYWRQLEGRFGIDTNTRNLWIVLSLDLLGTYDLNRELYKLGLLNLTTSSSQIVQSWFYSFQREQSKNLLFPEGYAHSFYTLFSIIDIYLLCCWGNTGYRITTKVKFDLFWRKEIIV